MLVVGSIYRAAINKATERRINIQLRSIVLGISERAKEIKRRRIRRARVATLKKRLEKANASEKEEIARKLRQLTPGAEVIISDWGLK